MAMVRLGENVMVDPSRIAGFRLTERWSDTADEPFAVQVLADGTWTVIESYWVEAEARTYMAQLVREHDARGAAGVKRRGCRQMSPPDPARASLTGAVSPEWCTYEWGHPGRHSWDRVIDG